MRAGQLGGGGEPPADLGQLIATSFGLKNLEIPLFGLYGACSTMGEALSLAAMAVDGGYAEKTMAPAAADLVMQNLIDFDITPEYYDKVITGDLGTIGQRALLDLLKEEGVNLEGYHMDCGIEIFDPETQDTHAGGSGCGCSEVTLCTKILRELTQGHWRREPPPIVRNVCLEWIGGNGWPGI